MCKNTYFFGCYFFFLFWTSEVFGDKEVDEPRTDVHQLRLGEGSVAHCGFTWAVSNPRPTPCGKR